MIEFFKIFEPFLSKMMGGFTDRKWNGNFAELGLAKPVTSDQVHGDEILVINQSPSAPPKGDALITKTRNLPVMVKVADCQGVLIYDPKTHTIAAVHSGWRGSAGNIIGKTIVRMTEMGCRPADLLVAVSPSIGLCCAEFTDPARELPPALRPFIHEKHVDFWSATRAQCMSAGIELVNLELPAKCTRCNPKRYFSHRRGDSQRMAAFIALK